MQSGRRGNYNACFFLQESKSDQKDVDVQEDSMDEECDYLKKRNIADNQMVLLDLGLVSINDDYNFDLVYMVNDTFATIILSFIWTCFYIAQTQ